MTTEAKGHTRGSRVGVHRLAAPEYERQAIAAGVTSALVLAGIAGDASGASRSPLSSIISPGDTVLLKPNMVGLPSSSSGSRLCVTTHGEVIRAVAVLAAQALEGKGRLVVADGPYLGSDFEAVAAIMQLETLRHEIDLAYGMELEILDLREPPARCGADGPGPDGPGPDGPGPVARDGGRSGDPLGYAAFDLAERSEFDDRVAGIQYRSNEGDPALTTGAHSEGRHRYRMARTALAADVYINLPKLKTHQKTGVTLALKNAVGVHGDRVYLPHLASGHPGGGGDESSWSARRLAIRHRVAQTARGAAIRAGLGQAGIGTLRRAGHRVLGGPGTVIANGNWHGNDTAWRMVLDLNKLLSYGRTDGSLGSSPARRQLTIVDGVVGGDGNGPFNAGEKRAGLLVAGLNPVSVDTTCCILMGFDPERISLVRRAWEIEELPLVDFPPSEVSVSSNVSGMNGGFADLICAPHLGFVPPDGWRGHMERSCPS